MTDQKPKHTVEGRFVYDTQTNALTLVCDNPVEQMTVFRVTAQPDERVVWGSPETGDVPESLSTVRLTLSPLAETKGQVMYIHPTKE